VLQLGLQGVSLALPCLDSLQQRLHGRPLGHRRRETLQLHADPPHRLLELFTLPRELGEPLRMVFQPIVDGLLDPRGRQDVALEGAYDHVMHQARPQAPAVGARGGPPRPVCPADVVQEQATTLALPLDRDQGARADAASQHPAQQVLRRDQAPLRPPAQATIALTTVRRKGLLKPLVRRLPEGLGDDSEMGDLDTNPFSLWGVDFPAQPFSDLPRGAAEDEHPSIPVIAEHVADPRRGPAAAALRPRGTFRVQDPRETLDPVPLRRQLEEPPHGRRLRGVHAQFDMSVDGYRVVPIHAAPRMVTASHLAEHLVADAHGRALALEGRAEVRDGHQQGVLSTLQLPLGPVREEDPHAIVDDPLGQIPGLDDIPAEPIFGVHDQHVEGPWAPLNGVH
jgi:hypothetical protein